MDPNTSLSRIEKIIYFINWFLEPVLKPVCRSFKNLKLVNCGSENLESELMEPVFSGTALSLSSVPCKLAHEPAHVEH